MKRIYALFFLCLFALSPAAAQIDEYRAAKTGELGVLRRCLRQGGNVNKPEPQTGATLLHFAAGANQQDAAQLLLEGKANVNATMRDGATPLHLAAARGYVAIVELLLKSGADVEAVNSQEQTPLDVAKAAHQEAVIPLLEKASAAIPPPPPNPRLTRGDWPEWRGPLRNGSLPVSPTLLETWTVQGPPLLWRKDGLPRGGNSSLAVSGSHVFMFIHDREKQQEFLVCIDGGTRKTLWQSEIEVDRKTLHYSSATPCVDGNRVYVMGCRVCYCFDTEKGGIVWKTDTGVPAVDGTLTNKGQEVSSSFLTVDNVAIVLCGPVFGLDKETGKILWAAPEAGGYAGAMTSAALWRTRKNAYLIYAGKYRICCLDPVTGKALWNLPGNQDGVTYAPSPAIADDTMVVYFRGKLRAYALNERGPRELWQVPFFDDYSSPAVANGFVYTVGPAEHRGQYQAICRSIKDGAVVWSADVEAAEYCSPVLADNKLFTLTDNATQQAMFDAKNGKPLGKFTVNALAWTSPSLAKGKLYLRTDGGVSCYKLTK